MPPALSSNGGCPRVHICCVSGRGRTSGGCSSDRVSPTVALEACKAATAAAARATRLNALIDAPPHAWHGVTRAEVEVLAPPAVVRHVILPHWLTGY